MARCELGGWGISWRPQDVLNVLDLRKGLQKEAECQVEGFRK